jgi:hypothetical protein
MPQQGRWLALAEAMVAGRFGLKLRKKFVFLPPLEPAMVMPVGVTDLVGGAVVEFCSLPSVVFFGGKPQVLRIG